MIADQHGEHLSQALHIAALLIVQPFRPCEDVRAGAARVERLKHAPAAVGIDLPADETIIVLFGIEVIQRADEAELPPCITPKQCHKATIPQERIGVERGIDEVGDEPRFRLRLPQISERCSPCEIVHRHPKRMIVRNQFRQQAFIVSGQRFGLIPLQPECVLRDGIARREWERPIEALGGVIQIGDCQIERIQKDREQIIVERIIRAHLQLCDDGSPIRRGRIEQGGELFQCPIHKILCIAYMIAHPRRL
jgi:hypothetical protein